MVDKKGIRPMGELIGAILITIIIVIVAAVIIWNFLGGLVSPEENAVSSGRNLAEGIDTIAGCNEADITISPDYRLVIDREKQTVTSQHRYKKEDSDKYTIEELETNEFDAPVSAICSPYSLDTSAHTTHCTGDYLTGYGEIEEFTGDYTFLGTDYLIINLNWDERVTETYCICEERFSGSSPQFELAAGKLIYISSALENGIVIYPKGWSFCGRTKKGVLESLPNKVKASLASAYDRTKNWLKKLVSK